MRPTVAEQRDVMRADGSMEHVDYDRFFLVQPDGTFLRSRGLELDPPVEIDPVADADDDEHGKKEEQRCQNGEI